jgi:hypothetical protein
MSALSFVNDKGVCFMWPVARLLSYLVHIVTGFPEKYSHLQNSSVGYSWGQVIDRHTYIRESVGKSVFPSFSSKRLHVKIISIVKLYFDLHL